MEDRTESTGGALDPLVDRAVRLFRYLREVQQLKNRPVRSVDDYAKVVWFHDLPQHTGVESALSVSEIEAGAPLLVIDRIAPTDPPLPPPEIVEWLGDHNINDPRSDPQATSALLHDGHLVHFEDEDALVRVFAGWRSEWSQWAEKEAVRSQVRRLYADVFKIGEQAAASPEELELLLAVGHLAWRPETGRTIARHIITTDVEVKFDEDTGQLSVVPADDFDGLHLELEMIDPGAQPQPDRIASIRESCEEYEGHVLDVELLEPVLHRIANVLSVDAVFDPALEPGRGGSVPTVSLAPALVLRKRTNQGLIRIYETIEEQLLESEEVPIGIKQLIDVVEASDDHDSQAAAPVVDAYLPLPANRQQLEIVERVDHSNHTVVQGPPGTGKTHTIANLLAHLLATGRRVLVTAQTDRALREIQAKLPEEIAQLTVSVVGRNRADLADLRVAVEAIANRASSYDATAAKSGIDETEKALDSLRRARSRLETQLVEYRENETQQRSRDGYSGTLASIAQLRNDQSGQFAWLAEYEPNTSMDCPLSNPEALLLLSLLRSPAIEKHEAEATRVLPTDVTDPDDFETLVTAEAENRAIIEGYADLQDHPAYEAISNLSIEERDSLQERIDALAETATTLGERNEQWMSSALAEILSGRPELWEHRHKELRERLNAVKPTIDRLGPSPNVEVEGGQSDLVPLAEALAEHLAKGGKLSGLVKPKPVRAARPLFERVQVDGVAPANEEQVRRFLDCVEAGRELDALVKLWPADVDIPEEDTYLERWAWNETETNQLGRVIALAAGLQDEEEQLAAVGVPPPNWSDLDSVRRYATVVDAIVAHEHATAAAEPLGRLGTSLNEARRRRNASTVSGRLADAVDRREPDTYRHTVHYLEELEEVRSLITQREGLTNRLAAGSPSLAEAVTRSPEDATWDIHMAALDQAWAWAQVGNWILAESAGNVNRIQKRVTRNEDETRDRITELTSASAWEHAVGRLGQRERESLNAYALAVRQLGKGTGKYAAHRRSEARKALRRCRTAVPAWVMPLYRIAETLDVDADIFDVVIIDEASQAGLDASFLQYIAKKIVVVGDHHQVSPAGVGINNQKLIDLTQQYLFDIDHIGLWQDPRVSFFDLARIKYGNLITLREHFRCVPEIIGFSNAIVYEPDRVPLIPLRQFGVDRLDPIKLTRVPDGYEKGTTNKVNPPEAETLIEEVLRCCSDPRYDGKTMGVISLTGKAQADYIEQELLDRLGPREFKARDMRCGDASSFQGSERDVIYLSMVAAPTPDRRLAALTAGIYVQRFNVAASRAKDQMWLFHSVELDELTNREDMRFLLLDYCTRLSQVKTAGTGGPSEPVAADFLVSPFDSMFEQHVYNSIAARGYSVVPQFPVYNYMIDLVIVGGHTRFGIECDGDSWHGADAYERDMARQRELERVGWTFFRVRASTYYRDPEEALAPLWKRLSKVGIRPAVEISVTDTLDSPAIEPDSHPPIHAERQRPESAGPERLSVDEAAYRSELIDAQVGTSPPFEAPDSETMVAAADGALDDDGTAPIVGARVHHGRMGGATIVANSGGGGGQPIVVQFDTGERYSYTRMEYDLAAFSPEEVLAEDEPWDPAPPVMSTARSSDVSLLPYSTWTGGGLPDPRNAKPREIAEGLQEIVAVEGPVTTDRAFHVYVKGAGFDRVTQPVRSAMNRGLHSIRADFESDEFPNPLTNWPQKVLRIPGTEQTIVRQLGPRGLYDVPLNEIAALMESLRSLEAYASSEALMRAVLGDYGLSRLTPKVVEYLRAAEELLPEN